MTIIERIESAIATEFKFFTVEMTYADWIEWSKLYPDVLIRKKLGKMPEGCDLVDSFDFLAEKMRMRDECRSHSGFYTLNHQWINVEIVD